MVVFMIWLNNCFVCMLTHEWTGRETSHGDGLNNCFVCMLTHEWTGRETSHGDGLVGRPAMGTESKCLYFHSKPTINITQSSKADQPLPFHYQQKSEPFLFVLVRGLIQLLLQKNPPFFLLVERLQSSCLFQIFVSKHEALF
jgi:hypothetical protein